MAETVEVKRPKTTVTPDEPRKALDFSNLLGDAKRRTQTPIKSLYNLFFLPGMLNLSAGLPHPSTFAFRSLSASVPDGPSSPSSRPLTSMSIPFLPSADSDAINKTIALTHSLQYGTTRGIPAYQAFVRQHTQEIHAPPYADWDVIGTVGNTDALSKAIGLIGSPGDTMLVDEWTYPAAVDTAQSHDVRLGPVSMDEQGMLPDALDQVLTNWTSTYGPDRPVPKMIYLVPTGQNPTGATMPLERRRAIYAQAQKHNLIIFEDDPYYYLQYADYQSPETRDNDHPDAQPGLSGLLPSFLSLDVDGRVIRMDSFSKILAPGSRTGWITASKQFLPYIEFHNETTVQQPSGLSQALLTELLTNVWSHKGWSDYLKQLQFDYFRRRNLFVDLVHRYLDGLADYVVPEAGMFVWLRPRFPQALLAPYPDPAPSSKGQSEAEAAASPKPIMPQVLDAMVEARVMLIPGYFFAGQIDRTERVNAPYLRAAFSFTKPEEFEPALQRLAGVLRQFDCGIE
ncbi:pyridoxal phosphate-dependent transferase [Dimargaris cristalligena]|uniref:Pyridoxal phosphate-dependent transferase n=1 Tax=Dimargaris cristalligena TaxID=215637 RepID=A0A4V1J5B0_9FUNG|nr:pyridoxal phosphate-dependent transferase [Dimargaris cristalligena]|eukprot:RKP38429.1 pyridoxal phosphate-dependent transferase [Dimargaris cristalligena]